MEIVELLLCVMCRVEADWRGEEEVSDGREKLKPPGEVCVSHILRLVLAEPGPFVMLIYSAFCPRH